MVEDPGRRITEYVHDRAEDGLRTVVIVREDSWRIQYLRDDLKQKYTEETFTEVVNTFRLESPFMSPGTGSQPVGERRAIVHYHEHAFVIQFPISETESILVSISRDTGRDLFAFIEDCRSKIKDGT